MKTREEKTEIEQLKLDTLAVDMSIRNLFHLTVMYPSVIKEEELAEITSVAEMHIGVGERG